MDPLDRADALLTRAQTRRGGVVTPNNMQSPMDASTTQQISRAMVDGINGTAITDPDPDATTRMDFGEIREHDPSADVTQDLRGEQEAEPEPEEFEVEEEEIDGFIPTTKQTQKSNLSARLDG